jgi:perosamine synthetase
VPLAAPALVGNERKYVLDCLETGWVSSIGSYVDRFEAEFAAMCGVRHAIACCNGTAALHLALVALGVGPGDEVIVPSLTFVSTANAVHQCGATPVFCDSDERTWSIDHARAEHLIGPRTRGIIPVHLYGVPAEMTALAAVARRHGLWILEDAAEAHGATHMGQRTGSMGTMGAFSFYGNKILTTGEGGMITTDDDGLAERARLYRGHGMDPQRRYWFPVIGFNYRMTNLAAAIGLGQLERLEWHLERRRAVASRYRSSLAGDERFGLQSLTAGSRSAYWMVTVLLDSTTCPQRDEVAAHLGGAGIETRPAFPPVHSMPPYAHSAPQEAFPVSEHVGAWGLTLPTHALLGADDVDYVVACLREAVAMPGAAGSGNA